MNAPRTKTALGNLKSAAFAQQHIGDGNANVDKSDVAVAVWCVIVAKNGQQPLYLYAGRVHGDKNHGLLLVFSC